MTRTNSAPVYASMELYESIAATGLRDKERFEHFVPSYLIPFLGNSASVCSIGCGSGHDVALLAAAGYDAYGFDPGLRAQLFTNHPNEVSSRLKTGSAEDRPFGRRQFNAAYALEVIEHVGCEHFGWVLMPDAIAQRQNFIDASLALLSPGGRLLLSSSNKLCPIDPGHGHAYTPLGRALCHLGIGLSVPWHPKNFLWSVGDIRRAVRRSSTPGTFSVKALGFGRYPKITAARGALGLTARAVLTVLSLPPLRASFMAPILCVEIVRA